MSKKARIITIFYVLSKMKQYFQTIIYISGKILIIERSCQFFFVRIYNFPDNTSLEQPNIF